MIYTIRVIGDKSVKEFKTQGFQAIVISTEKKQKEPTAEQLVREAK